MLFRSAKIATFIWQKLKEVFTGLATFVVDIFKRLWDNTTQALQSFAEIFRDTGIKIWNYISTPIVTLIDFVKKIFLGDFMGAISTLGEGIKNTFIAFFDILIWPFQAAWKVISTIWSFMGNNVSVLFDVIKNVHIKMFEVITWPFRKGWEVIKSVFSWDTMKEVFFNVVDGIKGALGAIADWGPFKSLIAIAKKVFKIESPSKVFAEIGDNVADGFNDSLEAIPENEIGRAHV